jgi:hypothetical protein
MDITNSALRDYYSTPTPMAADLPTLLPPKAPAGKLKTVPPYLGNAKNTSISNSITNTTNLVLSDHVRNEGTMNQVIKKLVLMSPDLSHAVETKIKSAISRKYTVIATDDTGRIDVPATELAQGFIQRLNLGSYDYTKFTRSTDIRSLTTSLLYDSFRYGAMALETVLGAMRLPAYFKPVAARLVDWADNTPTSYPVYKGGDEDIPLNFPTIFYSSSVQDGESAYADSPIQAAIQACMWDAEFINALRKAATKNLMQRLKVTIDSEAYIKTLPLAVAEDKDELKKHMNATVSSLESQLADLEPDDSLVIFDILDADTIADANRSEDRSIQVLQALINGKVAAGAKILPAIIGRGESSSAASTESLLFLKSVAASQLEVNILLSRALTFCIRLFGHEAYASFELEEVNLRPALELASFRAIEQSSTLEQLSVGFITDEKACIELTGALPPQGHTPLMGTMFHQAKAETENNDYSNTSATASSKPNSTQSQKSSGDIKQKGVKSK